MWLLYVKICVFFPKIGWCKSYLSTPYSLEIMVTWFDQNGVLWLGEAPYKYRSFTIWFIHYHQFSYIQVRTQGKVQPSYRSGNEMISLPHTLTCFPVKCAQNQSNRPPEYPGRSRYFSDTIHTETSPVTKWAERPLSEYTCWNHSLSIISCRAIFCVRSHAGNQPQHYL